MKTLPYKQYPALVRALKKQGITDIQIMEQLTNSHSQMVVNGELLYISKNRLLNVMNTLIPTGTSLKRVSIKGVRQCTLEQTLSNLKEEGWL